MNQVNPFEKMISESDIFLLKVYFSISKEEQKNRFDRIQNNPLKKWKMSKVDKRAQELWDEYTKYKTLMLDKTNTELAPWKIIKADRKTFARLELARFVVQNIPYENLRLYR
jgi:polyphosphate kinase 2 (PPK2 family)